MTSQLIVALDFSSLDPCEKILKDLKGLVKSYKVGCELFTSEGWRAVDLVRRYQGEAFLDLKLHDIPTTVAKTASVIARQDVWMFTVHTLGGLEMMQAARRAVDENSKASRKPKILGVTILTSHAEEELSSELGITRPLEEEVTALAHLAQKAGLDGVVSSPRETRRLRQELGQNLLLVTPGARPPESPLDDQKRSLSPREAVQAGANYLVVGRPVTASPDPRRAAEAILQSLP